MNELDTSHLEIEFSIIKRLIELVFEKAQLETRVHTRRRWYAYIADNVPHPSPSEKTIERYYKKYIEGEIDATGNPNLEIIESLAKWVGYESYADFSHKEFPLVQSREGDSNSNVRIRPIKISSNAKNIGVAVAIGVGVYFATSKTNSKPECMYWEGKKYELIQCDERVDPTIILIPVDKEKLKYFKLIEVSDTTTFFKGGVPQVWYLKVNGEIEYYSNPGFHPLNGKPLKPITQYIIDKYVIRKN